MALHKVIRFAALSKALQGWFQCAQHLYYSAFARPGSRGIFHENYTIFIYLLRIDKSPVQSYNKAIEKSKGHIKPGKHIRSFPQEGPQLNERSARLLWLNWNLHSLRRHSKSTEPNCIADGSEHISHKIQREAAEQSEHRKSNACIASKPQTHQWNRRRVI